MESQSLQAILRLQSNTLSQEQHLCSVRPSMMKNYMMDNSQLGLLLVLSTTGIIAYNYPSLSFEHLGLAWFSRQRIYIIQAYALIMASYSLI